MTERLGDGRGKGFGRNGIGGLSLPGPTAHLGRPRPRPGSNRDRAGKHRAGRRQATTVIGSPTLTVLKYQAALSGLRLMQPWLTLA